jgi:hypothetical protein
MLAKAKNDHANIKTTFLMNLLPEKKYGIPPRNFVKKNVLCEKGDEITRFDGILSPKQNFIQTFFICKGILRQVLSEFIDCRYSQSCWYFRPGFVNCCPSPLLSCSTLHPPIPCVNKYIVYTYTVYKGEGVWGSGPQTDKHLPQSPSKVTFFR